MGEVNVANHNNKNIAVSPEVNGKWRKTDWILLLYDILYILLRKTKQVEHVSMWHSDRDWNDNEPNGEIVLFDENEAKKEAKPTVEN